MQSLSEWPGYASLSDGCDRVWDYIHSRELADCNQGTWSNLVSHNGCHKIALLVAFWQTERILEISWEAPNWPHHHLPVHICQDQHRYGPLRSNFLRRSLSGTSSASIISSCSFKSLATFLNILPTFSRYFYWFFWLISLEFSKLCNFNPKRSLQCLNEPKTPKSSTYRY